MPIRGVELAIAVELSDTILSSERVEMSDVIVLTNTVPRLELFKCCLPPPSEEAAGSSACMSLSWSFSSPLPTALFTRSPSSSSMV